MATNLLIRQYTRLAHDEGGRTLPAGQEPGYDSVLPIDVVTGNVQIRPGTRFIRLHADGAACHFVLGADNTVTATTLAAKMAAAQTEFFGVTPNGSVWLAVIMGV